jgi:hypothetical protein
VPPNKRGARTEPGPQSGDMDAGQINRAARVALGPRTANARLCLTGGTKMRPVGSCNVCEGSISSCSWNETTAGRRGWRDILPATLGSES